MDEKERRRSNSKEARLPTTAHFAAAIATQALIDHLIVENTKTAAAHQVSAPNVKRRVEFDLAQIVHEG